MKVKLTTKDLAKIKGKSTSTFNRWERTGKIPSKRQLEEAIAQMATFYLDRLLNAEIPR